MKNKVTAVSNQFWEALKKVDVDALRNLVYEDAKFVHMGVMLDREGEIDWAVTEKIITKTVDVESEEVRVYGNTAVMLKKMQLTAIVYGEEHVNPFMVTEVYVKEDSWKLASLAYTKVNY
ncbi:MAG: nuclear transport factor 2 family protein [Ruminococcus flavefaciens]|nr:nuclear transport factor 2 family protein [Ruminococcus flavefaciens]